MRYQRFGQALAALALVAVVAPSAATAAPLGWSLQAGTAGNDHFASVVPGRSGELYAAGTFSGTVFGQTGLGGGDAALVRLSATGATVWARVFGSAGQDTVTAVDRAANGDLVVVGHTDGVVGTASAGGSDVFVARFSKTGVQRWIKQFGTVDDEFTTDVAVAASGAVYVTGGTSGTFAGQTPITGSFDSMLVKLDKNGNVVWARQYGGTGTGNMNGVAIGRSERIYTIGRRSEDMPGHTNVGDNDAFVTSFDKNGTQGPMAWLASAGRDGVNGLTVAKNGDVVVAGSTDGVLEVGAPGDFDAVVARFSKDLAPIWLRQFGTAAGDVGYRVAVDRTGGLHVVGYTTGSFGGPNQGSTDIFLTRVSATGTVGTTRQFGTSAADTPNGIAIRSSNANGGAVVVAAQTSGSVFGFTNAGNSDAILFTVPT